MDKKLFLMSSSRCASAHNKLASAPLWLKWLIAMHSFTICSKKSHYEHWHTLKAKCMIWYLNYFFYSGHDYVIVVFGWNSWIIKTSRFVTPTCHFPQPWLLSTSHSDVKTMFSPTTAVKLVAICISAARCSGVHSAVRVWNYLTNSPFINVSYSRELLEKVVEMAEGIEVEDAPVFKTRDEIVRNQQVHFLTHTQMLNCIAVLHVFLSPNQARWTVLTLLSWLGSREKMELFRASFLLSSYWKTSVLINCPVILRLDVCCFSPIFNMWRCGFFFFYNKE